MLTRTHKGVGQQGIDRLGVWSANVDGVLQRQEALRQTQTEEEQMRWRERGLTRAGLRGACVG